MRSGGEVAAAAVPRGREGESGAALVFVLVLLAVLGVLGAGLAGAVTGSARLIKEREEQTAAWYAAEAGVDYLVAWLEAGEDLNDVDTSLGENAKTPVGSGFFWVQKLEDKTPAGWSAFEVTGERGERLVTVDVLLRVASQKDGKQKVTGLFWK